MHSRQRHPLLAPASWSRLAGVESVSCEQRRPFILSGYRLPCASCACLLHNETGNALTHLLWLPAFVACVVDATPLPDPHRAYALLLSAAACYMVCSSAAYHWGGFRSPLHARRLLCLDICGIVLTAAATVAWGTRIVFCKKTWVAHAYAGAFCAGAAGVCWKPTTRNTAAVLAFMAVPLAHAAWVEKESLAVAAGRRAGALLTAASAFYVSGVPERLCSGAFDFVLQSHQFWHVLTASAVHCCFRGFERAAYLAS